MKPDKACHRKSSNCDESKRNFSDLMAFVRVIESLIVVFKNKYVFPRMFINFY